MLLALVLLLALHANRWCYNAYVGGSYIARRLRRLSKGESQSEQERDRERKSPSVALRFDVASKQQ